MTSLRCLILGGLSCVLAGSLFAAQESIAVSATAVKGYVRTVDAAGKPQAETYLFSEGRFFGGETVDRGLAKTSFDDVTRSLATQLARRNYFPTKEVETANLLIRVHWGMTSIYEDPQRDFNIAGVQAAAAEVNAGLESGNIVDRNNLNNAQGMVNDARESTANAIERNAILLGYRRTLDKERKFLQPSGAEITMNNELNEERYFVILMAYDYQKLRKDRQSKLLWVTRLSVRSPGNNFMEALPTLARVGADVYGQHKDELVKVRAPVQRGTVKLGELEVLGTVPNPVPEKSDKPADQPKPDK